MGPPAKTVVALFVVGFVVGRFLLDEATVVLLFDSEGLPSGTTLTIELSGGTGFFSDVGGQEQVNSLVLEVQELRFLDF